MTLNYSASLNSTSDIPALSISLTIHDLMFTCLNSEVGTFSITAFGVMCILLLLPLCIYVLYLGYQRIRHQHSSTTTSHSDVFTYNMVVIELMNVMGSVLCCCGVHAHISILVMIGVYLFSVTFSAQLLFHVLTCVERYLAIVHPVIYLGLRSTNGIRIRNLIIVLFWLLSFGGTGVMSMTSHTVTTVVSYCIVGFAVIATAFCSISVLYVLIHSRPGEEGSERHVDQLKLRAFHTIMAILGVLLLRFVGNISTNILYDSQELNVAQRCGVWLSEFWFCLPSSLVLPLLFLHRAEKLPCSNNSASGDRGGQSRSQK